MTVITWVTRSRTDVPKKFLDGHLSRSNAGSLLD